MDATVIVYNLSLYKVSATLFHHVSAIEVAENKRKENKIKYVLIERHSSFPPRPIKSGTSKVTFDSKVLVIVIKTTNCIKSIDDDIAVMMFLLLLAMFLFCVPYFF